MKDFPAAHSMDSTWFAVDEEGQVAVFDTDEGGCLPEGEFPRGGEAGGYRKKALEADQLLARVLWARAQKDERLRALLPGDLRALEKRVEETEAWDLVDPLLRFFGVWTYECGEADAWPYERIGAVPEPVRLDELDEDTRRRFQKAKLPLRFGDEVLIAPGEFLPVSAWGPVWFDREGRAHATVGKEEAFERIAADIPGRDEEWWDFVENAGQEADVLSQEAAYRGVEKLLAGHARSSSDEPRSWWRRLLGLG